MTFGDDQEGSRRAMEVSWGFCSYSWLSVVIVLGSVQLALGQRPSSTVTLSYATYAAASRRVRYGLNTYFRRATWRYSKSLRCRQATGWSCLSSCIRKSRWMTLYSLHYDIPLFQRQCSRYDLWLLRRLTPQRLLYDSRHPRQLFCIRKLQRVHT